MLPNGSPKAVAASSKVTPCFRAFAAAFCGSHSNVRAIGKSYAFRDLLGMRLTDRASAAATSPSAHCLTFLTTEAPASCMRLLGGRWREKVLNALPQIPQGSGGLLIVAPRGGALH